VGQLQYRYALEVRIETYMDAISPSEAAVAEAPIKATGMPSDKSHVEADSDTHR
jgi:hypothetical protein